MSPPNLPAGAICASAVDIYISGITAFANNTAEARGGEKKHIPGARRAFKE